MYAYLHLFVVATSLCQIQPGEDRAQNISHMYPFVEVHSSRHHPSNQVGAGLARVVPSDIYLVEMCNGQCRRCDFDLKINGSYCFDQDTGRGQVYM